MRAAFTVLALGMATAGTAAAQAVDKEKLREAARLPVVSGRMGIASNAEGEFVVEGEKTDPRAEIKKLNAAVKRDPSDGPRYYKLGTFHDQLGEEVQANQAYAKALELCRRQLKHQPNDGALLVLEAKALYACGKEEEAVAVLHEAVKRAPQAWQSHQALGSHLQQKALYELLDGHLPSVRRKKVLYQLSPA
jgi:tetratricopeptide (TPR) repeat protein